MRPATGRGLAAAGAVLAVAAGLLSGCGGGDSTVAGVPDSETLAPPPGSDSGPSSTRAAPSEDSGRYTEAPEPVPADSPGYSTPAVGARERGYLAALEDKDVETAEIADSLMAAGNTICRIRSTGGAAGETTTIADAVAGQISAGGYSDRKVEELSRIVIDTAAGQLCP